MKNVSQSCLAMVVICVSITASAGDSKADENSALLSRETLQQKSKSTADYLRFNLGQQRFESLTSTLQASYADFLPVEACKGTFVSLGELDVGLMLVDKEFARGAYVVAHGNKITRLANFGISKAGDGTHTKLPTISCQSWTELALTRATYKRLSASSASYSNLRTVTNLDSLCVVPLKSEMEFTCFSYNQKKAAFVDVGGWFND